MAIGAKLVTGGVDPYAALAVIGHANAGISIAPVLRGDAKEVLENGKRMFSDTDSKHVTTAVEIFHTEHGEGASGYNAL